MRLYQVTLENYRMRGFSYWKTLQRPFIVVKHILNIGSHNQFIYVCTVLAAVTISLSFFNGLLNTVQDESFVWKLAQDTNGTEHSAYHQYFTYLPNK